jgi:CHAT domain-containing protein
VTQVRPVLRQGEALISTLVTDDRTFVWAFRREGPIAFTVIPLGRDAIRAAVAHLRRALDASPRLLGDIPAFDIAAAHELYRALLEPVKAGWAGATTLLVVPHGPLGQVPFALLPTEASKLPADEDLLFSRYRKVPWLARSHAAVVLPSAGALVTLREKAVATPDRRPFIGFGAPDFGGERNQRIEAPRATPVETLEVRRLKVTPKVGGQLANLPPLPDTADEIREIAATLRADPERDVFLGARATEQAVRTADLSKYRVVAFATHGLVAGDLDGLTQPALALAPSGQGGGADDGFLTMEKILGLRMNADWVVLSACNTANGRGDGEEAISGLGRAFFYAGARALLVTSWPVETTSARKITTELFQRQVADSTLSRARALQQTMLGLIDGPGFVDTKSGRTVFSYAHPIFWAPFVLVGDGG